MKFFEKIRNWWKAYNWDGLFAIVVFVIIGACSGVTLGYGCSINDWVLIVFGIAGIALALMWAIHVIKNIHAV